MAGGRGLGLETAQGPVEVVTYCTPAQVEALSLHPGIGVFDNFRSLLASRQVLAHQAADPQANLCLSLHQGRQIVGYCLRRPPQAGERWTAMDPPILHEILAETARGWRGQKLMRPMLKLVVEEPQNQERILYIVGYSWTWDLAETGKTSQEYRQTLISLLAPLGFKEYPTNEPNVSLRPENLFMARIGERVAQPLRRRFTNLLFGIGED